MLDEKDLRIIGALRKNSRASLREISKETGIVHTTVQQRLSRLTKKKIIRRFTIELDREALGDNLTAFVLLNMAGSSFTESEIKEIHRVSGEYDTLLKVCVKDISSLENFLSAFRKKHEPAELKTIISTKVEKAG